jgi:HEAT repeat protein
MTDAEPTLEDYIAWMRDPDPDVRRNAAWVLGRQRDIRIVEPLLAAVNDEDADVRVRVMEALGNVKDARVIAPLMTALGHDSDAEVRACAARSLGNSEDPQAVDSLIGGLADSDGLVRTASAGALGAIPDARAIQPLVTALLRDADNDVLDQAAKSLVQIGGEQTVTALIESIDQAETPGVLIYIIETLGQLYDRRAVEPLTALLDHPDDGVRETVRWALKQLE